MDETRDQQNGANLDRRKFLGALAGAAATGALLQRGGGAAKAQGPTAYYYEDSFGNILPCSPDTIAAGILPPPIPSRATLLTGLYSQQTCMFVTEDPGSPYPPSLQPWVPATPANSDCRNEVVRKHERHVLELGDVREESGERLAGRNPAGRAHLIHHDHENVHAVRGRDASGPCGTRVAAATRARIGAVVRVGQPVRAPMGMHWAPHVLRVGALAGYRRRENPRRYGVRRAGQNVAEGILVVVGGGALGLSRPAPALQQRARRSRASQRAEKLTPVKVGSILLIPRLVHDQHPPRLRLVCADLHLMSTVFS